MQTEPDSTSGRQQTTSPLTIVTLGLACALLFSRLLTWAIETRAITDQAVLLPLGYLVFWVPALGSVALIARHGTWRSWLVRFSIRPLDLLFGLGLGLLLRGVASSIDLLVYGRSSFLPIFLPTSPSQSIVFALTMFVVPIIIAPLIEELFFRGAMLSSLAARIPVALAIVLSSAAFTLAHIVNSPTPAAALASGLSLFIVGVLLATLASLTRRIGGAMIAHATFNGSLVLWSLL
ncbi:MAG: CPBP family intramembrane glutamic endopeptidase [Rhodoglobus sp.]